jgi:hypothetical protein
MRLIEQDIAMLKSKYGSMRSIPTAEAILRLCRFAENRLHKDEIEYRNGKHEPLATPDQTGILHAGEGRH